jgi:flagellar L-ring protein FlgH
MKYIYTIILIVFLFTGCMSKKLEPKINFDIKPIPQPVKIVKPKVEKKIPTITKNNGSLFSSSNDLYISNEDIYQMEKEKEDREKAKRYRADQRDKRDLLVGDIIQVKILEEMQAISDAKRETKKSNNTDVGGGLIVPPLPVAGFTPNSGIGRITDKVNSNINLGFKSDSNNQFKGEIKSNQIEKFETIISSIIQQKYQNGNYLVYGIKEILIDGQYQKIIIKGIARPYDIEEIADGKYGNQYLRIDSDKLANAKIKYEKKGADHDSVVKPWGSTIIENIWPF